MMERALVRVAVDPQLTGYFKQSKGGREVRDSLPTLIKEVKDNG